MAATQGYKWRWGSSLLFLPLPQSKEEKQEPSIKAKGNQIPLLLWFVLC